MVGVSASSASPAVETLQGQLALAGSAGLLREGTLVHLNR